MFALFVSVCMFVFSGCFFSAFCVCILACLCVFVVHLCFLCAVKIADVKGGAKCVWCK